MLHGDTLLELKHRIGKQSIQQGNTNGMTVKPALELRKDHRDGLGRASDGGDRGGEPGAHTARIGFAGTGDTG